MDTKKYYKEYYIKHKEYILKQKADWRKANRLYNNQLKEIKVVILDKRDGNVIRYYFCSGIV
jgi:hypothetical protein